MFKFAKYGPKLKGWGTKAFSQADEVLTAAAFGAVNGYALSLFFAEKELASSPWTLAPFAITALYLLINLFLKLKNRHV